MKRRFYEDLPHGFYEIFWKSGGSSKAAVGSLPDGRRWMAPINWVGGMGTADWDGVISVKRLDVSDTEEPVSSPMESIHVTRLRALAEEDSSLQEKLDDIVHDLFSDQASSLNNCGPDDQIDYLIEEIGVSQIFAELGIPMDFEAALLHIQPRIIAPKVMCDTIFEIKPTQDDDWGGAKQW